MSAPECRCYVDYRLDLGPYIIRCDLHTAAEQMFEALEPFEQWDRIFDFLLPPEKKQALFNDVRNAANALAAARGGKVPA